MAIDKVLGKIQAQIKELAPTLELFVEDTIHPSVKDCEMLQKQLTELQENIAVYKFNKKEKELSPSFNIHAKVSEAKVEPAKQEEIPVIKQEEKKTTPVIETNEVIVTANENVTKKEEPQPEKIIAPVSFGINDKFRFINELFKQNTPEYNVAIEQLQTLRTWNEAEIYLSSLKSLYEWKDSSEVVIYFYSLIKKRYQ